MKYSKILAVIHWATWLAHIKDKQWLGESQPCVEKFQNTVRGRRVNEELPMAVTS